MEQNAVHGNQGQGKTPSPRRTAKITTMPETRNGKPNTSSRYLLVSDLPRKTQHTQALGGTALFTPMEKRQSKMSSNRVSQPRLASGASGSRCRENGLGAPSRASAEGPWLLLVSTESRGKPKGHCLTHLSRTKKHSWCLKQKIFPREVLSVGSLSFGKEG